MRVWILKDAEPLPLRRGQRALRSGMLAQELGRRGHQVVWWSSNFSHHLKQFIFDRDTRCELMPNVTLFALSAGSYRRNISFARVLHHRRLGRRFQQLAVAETSPDIIVSALPIIDLPFQASCYAASRGIPSIVDIRDPWPDVFADKAPVGLRSVIRWLTGTERRRAGTALQQAVALTAVSRGFLQWALDLAGRPAGGCDRVFYLGHPGFSEGTGRSQIEALERLKGKLVFSFVGTFGHSYEVELVGRAAQFFVNSHPEVTFVLVGDGQQMSVLRARFGDLPNLILTGWLDTPEIAAVLEHSHVGLVPCRSMPNTVPNKPFEYLAAGLPLLSSLHGEMAEMIASYGLGLSYRAGDLAGLIEAVKVILRERTVLTEWSSNARRAFRQQFSAERIYPDFASHVEEVYESACRSGGKAIVDNLPTKGSKRNV